MDDASLDVSGSRIDLSGLPDTTPDTLRRQYRTTALPPDQAAEANSLSRQTGLPRTVVQRNLEDARKRAAEPDWEALDQSAPISARELARNAKLFELGNDDTQNMGAIEQGLKYGKRAAAATASGLPAFESAVYGWGQAFGDVLSSYVTRPLAGTVLPEDYGAKFAAGMARWRQQQEQIAKGWMPSEKDIGFMEQSAYSGLQSMGLNLLQLPVAIMTGQPELALGSMAATTGGQEYGKARDKGLPIEQSLAYAASQATIEYATEKIPVHALLGDLAKNTPMWKTIVHQMAGEIPGEQVATILQDLNEWAALNPDKPFSSYLEERPSAAAQTLIATIVATGGQTAVMHVGQRLIEHVGREAEKAQQAQQDAAALEQLGQLVAASKLRARDPKTFAEFVEAANDGNPVQDVYVDPNVLAATLEQSGVSPASIPAVAQQLNEALTTGADVAIPVADYTAQIAGTDLGNALLPHIRTSPEAMSLAEAETFYQEAQQRLQKQAEAVLQDQAQNSVIQQGAQSITDNLLQQLNAANRFTPEVNNAYAQMMRDFYVVTAQRLGITPQEMFSRYPLMIAAENIAGDRVMTQPGYANAPDSLMGFSEQSPQKPFGAQKYKHVEYVRVEHEGSTPFVDAIAGLNKVHALERANRNWEGAKITPLTEEQATAEDATIVSDVKRAMNVGGPVFEQTATVRSGKETLKKFGLKPGEKYTTRQVAAALETRQRAKYGSIDRTDRSPEAAKKIAKWMVEEVEFEMQHPERSGVGWYSSKFQRALDTFAKAFPELATDQQARNTFTALIAITSDGQKVVPNFAMAADIYGNFRETGKFTTSRGHTRIASIENNLSKIQKLYDEMGPEAMARYLLDELTVSEINKRARAEGLDVKTDYQAHIKLPTAALVFGPKLGAFYANLMGAHGYLTMDRWWSRTFNRYRGHLLMAPTKDGLDRFRQLMGKPELSDEEVMAATVAPRNSYAAKNYKSGTELEKAANTIYKAAFENLEDTPFNATDRTFMLDAVNLAQKQLSRKGVKISIADIQAVLWYYEKRLYGELGARQSADVSYEEAAQRVVNDRAGADQSGGPAAPDAGPAGEEAGAGQVPGTGEEAGPAPGDEEFQLEQDGSARGHIAFGTDITQYPSVITLLQNADLSTFLHESGHFYLEVLNHVASQIGAPADVVKDMNAVLAWFGVKDLGTWQAMDLEAKRPFHEQFARGFEAYLFEGKSPNVEVQGMFSRFRAWLIQVYQSIRALNVQLNDEVRGVFDRLLATDQQIQAAEAARSFVPLFATPEEAGMTAEEWAAYQALGKQATQTAKDDLAARSLKDMQWLSNARSRALKAIQKDAAGKRKIIQAEVEQQVDATPIYAAMRFITKGELAEGDRTNAQRRVEEAAGMQGTKLSMPALKAMYGDDPAVPWRYLPTNMVTAEEGRGLHPDLVAQLFGFTSGDELVRKLLAAEPRKELVEGLTDQRMLERHGDLVDPAEQARAADKAIHNEVRGRFLAAELDALEKANTVRGETGRVNAKGRRITTDVLAKAAKDFAERMIGGRRITEIKPAQFEAAEARAAKAAAKAQKAGDLQTAAMQKRNELINLYATREAYSAVTEVERAIRYLTKFNKESVRKGLSRDYVDQIDALLERFDLRKSVTAKELKRRASLAAWVESQRENLIEPVIDEDLLNDAYRQHYSSLRLEQLRGLVDTVKNIEHLGRLKQKLLTAQDKREFEAVAGDLAASIADNATGTVKERRQSDRGPLVAAGAMFRNFLSDHRKFASIIRQFDGWKDGGKAWEYLVRNMNRAGDFEAVQREKATMKMGELLAPILKAGKLHQKQFFPTIGKSFTREERLGMALNMGNEINAERVMTGEGLSPEQLSTVLETLSKEDWDFVQAVWDYLESFRPMIAEKEKRLTGVEPTWVEPNPVQTRHGIYRGGYYPIKYDVLRSSKSEADVAAEVQKQIQRGLYTRAQTRRGHLKARAESTGRAIRYDLNVIVEHLDQVIHDLAWHEYLIDANRLLRAGAVDQAVRTHYGPEIQRTMRDTLADVAKGDVAAVTAGDKVLNYLRTGATVAGLGWRLTTSLMQPLGLTQSAARIGTKWVLKGARHWMGDAAQFQNSVRIIGEKSEMMRLRAKTMQREINEIRNKVKGSDSRLQASYFWMIQKMQLVADVPTWWGAYEKAMAQPDMTEAKAIALADQAVLDAQGGGQIKDLATVQRGSPAWKLFTNFYSFFNTTYNLTRESVGRTNFKKPGDVAMLAADLALLYTIPAILGTLVKAFLKGDWDDEDKLARRLIADQLNYLLGTVVVLREINSAVQGVLGLSGDYTGTAGGRFFSDFSNLAKQVNQGEADAAFWKALNNVGGDLFHYPAGQINATAEGIAALADGRTSNPGALLVGPPSR